MHVDVLLVRKHELDQTESVLRARALPHAQYPLLEAGKVSEEISANLPPAELIQAIEFPTAEQIDKANAVLVENWGPMVADA